MIKKDALIDVVNLQQRIVCGNFNETLIPRRTLLELYYVTGGDIRPIKASEEGDTRPHFLFRGKVLVEGRFLTPVEQARKTIRNLVACHYLRVTKNKHLDPEHWRVKLI